MFKELYSKNKEIILYLFFGVLTTIVSIVSFYLFYRILGIHEIISTIISWICAVLFAYYTNSKWVFNNENIGNKVTIVKFFAGRLFSLLLEEIIMIIFVTKLGFDGILIKTIAQVVVIVLNYIISKLFVFK